MTAGEPTQITVQDGRDLGYAAVPQIIIERLRERLAAGPLTRALSSSVLLASELNLAQLREGAAVWAPDKVTLGARLMLSEHSVREAIDAVERVGLIRVERGRWEGTTRLPNRITLQTIDGPFCAVTRHTIAAVVDRCVEVNRSRAHAIATYLSLVWVANEQRAAHEEEPRRRATVTYPRLAALSGVSEPHARRVVKDLMAGEVLQDITTRTNGTRVAKTWRLVEPPSQPASHLLTETVSVISHAPSSDPSCATDRSAVRDRPISSAPPSDPGRATEQSEVRDRPLSGAPTRTRESHHEQQAPGILFNAGQGVGRGGEGNEPGTIEEAEIDAVIDAMVAMLARRANGNERRARRRAGDPAWRDAARELLADGYSLDELAALMDVAECDLALGHRITCLPSLNQHLDALQARLGATRTSAAGTSQPASEHGVDALVALITRTLQLAPPRATRQDHLDTAHRIDPAVADANSAFLAELPWSQLGQRDRGALRHAILDAWRADTHRRAA